MNAVAQEPQPWSPRRWWWTLGIVFVSQVGTILWLSDWSPLPVRQPRPAPPLRILGADAQEFYSVHDPTLFALPSDRGFSGQAWQDVLRQTAASVRAFAPAEWSEPLRWRNLEVGSLGSTFARLTDLARPQAMTLPSVPQPEPSLPVTEPTVILPGASRLLLEAQGAWKVREPVELPAWPHTEVLTNTVVQVVVDASGWPFSAALLSRCGLAAADQYALDLARKLPLIRMETGSAAPGEIALDDLSWVNLVFAWHTAPATNAPPAEP